MVKEEKIKDNKKFKPDKDDKDPGDTFPQRPFVICPYCGLRFDPSTGTICPNCGAVI